MDIYLTNTRSGRKELFFPADPRRVTMYVCGPTVYSYVHIGNGRPAVVFDVLSRVLEIAYGQVVYARNVTDVDDKINAAARANGESIKALADRYTEAYNEDVASLGVRAATIEPRATEHMDEIIAMIGDLIDSGHAYPAEGHVLFDVLSDPDYGKLSRRSLEDMLDGARVEIAPYKKDAKDFVLWKPSPDDLPGWDSPWGRGRPGWHIECSAMIRKHLGTTIDIHGGGSDLTFPHHENEDAQSRCANGNGEYVRFWLHNGMLTLGAEKMSKSIGNVETIRDLRQQHSGEVLRYALLSGQYRSPLAWTKDLLKQARSSLDGLYQALRLADGARAGTALDYAGRAEQDYPNTVLTALCDDLNTPAALAAMHAIAGDINKSEDPNEAQALRQQLLAGGWLLGLLTNEPESYFKGSGDESALTDEHIQALIDERNASRAARDFQRADDIRAQLADQGIELEDTGGSTRWRRRQS